MCRARLARLAAALFAVDTGHIRAHCISNNAVRRIGRELCTCVHGGESIPTDSSGCCDRRHAIAFCIAQGVNSTLKRIAKPLTFLVGLALVPCFTGDTHSVVFAGAYRPFVIQVIHRSSLYMTRPSVSIKPGPSSPTTGCNGHAIHVML